MWPQDRIERAVGDLDQLDWLRLRLKARPKPESRQEVLGRSRERQRASIIAPDCLWRLGVNESDTEAIRRKLGERERQRASGKAAAGDRHIELVRVFSLCFWHCTAMPRSASAVNLLKGSALVTKGFAHEPCA